MPGGVAASSVTSICSWLAVAPSFTVCMAIGRGNTSLGSGSRSLPLIVSVVVAPDCKPRKERLPIVGGAAATRETETAIAQAANNGPKIRHYRRQQRRQTRPHILAEPHAREIMG